MISHLIKWFIKNNIDIKVGIELEFYSDFKVKYFKEKFEEIHFKNEIGINQIEAVFMHSSDVLQVLKKVILFRIQSSKIANFNAVYKDDSPTSAMQFNISAMHSNQNIINNSVLNSLLQEVPKSLKYFAPSVNCIERISNYNRIEKFRNSPFTLCVGNNSNRTAAIRIRNNYIEHRVPSSKAIIIKSAYCILRAIKLGITHNLTTYVPIIHSNAFEQETIEKFNLKKIYEK